MLYLLQGYHIKRFPSGRTHYCKEEGLFVVQCVEIKNEATVLWQKNVIFRTVYFSLLVCVIMKHAALLYKVRQVCE